MHKNYSDYIEFKRNLDRQAAQFISESQSFIALTDPKGNHKTITLQIPRKSLPIQWFPSNNDSRRHRSKIFRNSLDHSPKNTKGKTLEDLRRKENQTRRPCTSCNNIMTDVGERTLKFQDTLNTRRKSEELSFLRAQPPGKINIH